MKLAANISPVEAVRFTSPQKKIKNRTKRKKISPCSLGMLNFRRDWKKTVSIVFSLSLGGILLLAVSSLLILQSPEKLARQHFKNGDYKIYMDSDKEHIDLLKQGNPLNEELKQEIQDIDGVEEILVTRKSAGFEATFHGITAHGTCDMITRENRELLVQTVLEGSMPGDNGILLKDNYRDFDGKEKVGETIELSLGEKTIPVTISGFFDGKKTIFASGHGPIGVDGPMMFLPEKLFQELIPDVTNFDYSWDIVCDPDKSEKVGKALENLVVSHTDIGLDTFEDKVDSYGYMNVAYGIMQVISWFIFLFGVINLINTTLSNQYSRRQENSVLRSVGLAPKQLTQMAVWEGMGYVVSSILLMLAIGLPITLLVWRKFSISAYAGQILPYEFPWLQMGVYVVVLVTVEFILSVWTIRRQKKQSLIEQMRAME
ncbi:ABC transporter permease [Blautia wexlerae]|uniref:ABC transporter permease n=1 Tax=Blautia wexlerae TaxID=418240 RepID=UPI001FA7894A|nr:ABC transporter permease [Blautia wexlerae]UWO22558.1 ABC transporter permease [Blautia wexlerae DSM 19850]